MLQTLSYLILIKIRVWVGDKKIYHSILINFFKQQVYCNASVQSGCCLLEGRRFGCFIRRKNYSVLISKEVCF
jgi:hypothetical protein